MPHSIALGRIPSGGSSRGNLPKPNCEMAVVSATYMSTSIPALGHHIRPSDIAPALLPVQASRLSPVLLGDYVRTVRSTIARRSAVPSTEAGQSAIVDLKRFALRLGLFAREQRRSDEGLHDETPRMGSGKPGRDRPRL